jgi:acyl-coenzyme A synthetase/AMP-(fatty) acid ligase
VEISVRDPQGRAVGPGNTGELAVRGGMVMREYWKQPALTAETLRDGWLHTGDCGRQDDEGYLFLVGRQDDMINVGGLKVSPDEVEEALRQHPRVLDAACVGQADPGGVTGQCVKAFIISDAELAAAELAAWLRDKLEEYKIPRLWERTASIPKTSSGKIQRHLLRDQMSPLLPGEG